jgi:hypothetical protein
MDLPPFVYVILLLLAIFSGVMVNVTRYGWKSQRWTMFFAVLGVTSILVLMIVVLTST